jgi:RNA polymerase sigma factor (sigma-70 family)
LAEFRETGDQAAFEEIVRRYAGMVFGVCLRTTKNPHDAEDATQAVFLSLAVQCKTGDGVKFVGPWLQQVAKRVSLDIKRSRKRRETREQRHHAMNGNGNGHSEVERTGAVDVDDLKVVLSEELNQLPSKYRLPLVLHYFGGMTRDEMSRELNCKPATLGVRIHRGREMLGRRLHERGAAPAGLVLSALITGAVAQQVADAMVARTVEAACKLSNGQDLGSMIASNVLALSKSAAAGAAMAAKIKTVAAILIVALLTACAGGAVARLAPIQLKLPDVLKRSWLPKFRAPVIVPQANAIPPAVAPQSKQQDTARPTPIVEPATVRVAQSSPRTVVTPSANLGSAPAAAKVAPAPVSHPARLAVVAPQPKDIESADRFRSSASRVVMSAGSNSDSSGSKLQAAAAPGSTELAAGVSASGDVALGKADSTTPITSEAGKQPVETGGAAYLSVGAGGGGGFVGVNAGANLAIDRQDVGLAGRGVMDVNGGTDTFSQLRIGVLPGSDGTVNVRGNGKLLAKRGGYKGVNGIEVGGQGDGTLNVGDANSTGNILATGDAASGSAEPSLVVRGNPLGTGTLRGHGTVNFGGTLENNGWTIADGYGKGRSLDFDGFKEVINSIENPAAGGTHGWYAEAGARLALPAIHVTAGTGTYTWGESADDDVIDLVNSSRVTLYDVPRDGLLNVCLLSLDRGGIPPLPKGHTFIGVWQMDLEALTHDPATGLLTSTPMDPSGMDLTVRYDDDLAARYGLDENVLKLWKYQDGKWSRILDDFERYPDEHILTGHTSGGIEYYAVSAPEPGALSLLLLAGGAALLRRPRRRN